jgi:hypothetical protein
MSKAKLEKLNAVLDYLLAEQYVKLNVPTLRKIMEIDPTFDFNKFDIKRMPMTILYSRDKIYDWSTRKEIPIGKLEMKKMNTKNCYQESVWDMTGFKILGSDKVFTDLNVFVRDIDNVCTIYQNKLVDWKNKIYEEAEYQVKFLKSAKNIKTFRFVLHSYTKRAHNLETINSGWRKLEEYYINGNSMKKEDWTRYSREFKLQRVLK